MPKELNDKILSWIEDLDSIQTSQETPVFIDGKLENKEEILDMIIKATGINSWRLEYEEVLDINDTKALKNTYGIDFKEKEVLKFMFSRSTNNRNALYAIFVTVLPGFFEVDLHTDRASYSLNKLVDIEEFKKQIAIECDC